MARRPAPRSQPGIDPRSHDRPAEYSRVGARFPRRRAGSVPQHGSTPCRNISCLGAAARTLSLTHIMRMTDDDARDTLKRIRWSSNGGEPLCPHCGCLTVYTLAESPPRWKCSGCRRKFSLTSQTLFHSRKLPVRDYLTVIALFVNGVKGTSALQISRDLNINPKSAFVLLHKLREAIAGSQSRRARAVGHGRGRRHVCRRQHQTGEPEGRSD